MAVEGLGPQQVRGRVEEVEVGELGREDLPGPFLVAGEVDVLGAPERWREESRAGRAAARDVFSQDAAAAALERLLADARAV